MHTITLTIQTVDLTEGDLNTLADDLMAAAMAVTNMAEYEGEGAMTGTSTAPSTLRLARGSPRTPQLRTTTGTPRSGRPQRCWSSTATSSRSAS